MNGLRARERLRERETGVLVSHYAVGGEVVVVMVKLGDSDAGVSGDAKSANAFGRNTVLSNY